MYCIPEEKDYLAGYKVQEIMCKQSNKHRLSRLGRLYRRRANKVNPSRVTVIGSRKANSCAERESGSARPDNQFGCFRRGCGVKKLNSSHTPFHPQIA